MRTVITEGNPYGADRYGYCWEAVRELPGTGPHLDFGSYDGAVAFGLLDSGIVSAAVAADVVDVEAQFKIRHKVPAPDSLQFVSARRLPLPFEDSHFDSISLLDVLEHVADQDALLLEVRRLLAPGGRIVVTVPQRHVFSALDMGNWKFIFPRAHKRYYTLTHSQQEYESRYIDPDDGLIGDIEIAKSWHEHFTEAALVKLLGRNGLGAVSLDGAGLFARPLSLLRFAAPAALSGPITRMIDYDAARFSSTHLFCTARKVS